MPMNTAEKIIQTATQMFADRGFEGTIMDELAEQAQVNKASIYYHFGDKSKLFVACMESLFENVIESMIQAMDNEKQPVKKVQAYIQCFAQQAYSNPELPAVMMREIASGGLNLPSGIHQEMRRIVLKLRGVLDQGVELDQFKAVDALTLHLMVVGSIAFFVCSKDMREQKIDAPVFKPGLDQVIEQICQTLLYGLLTNPSHEKVIKTP